MSTPPRRRRNPDASDSGGGGGWLPTIAIGLGVVIAGLGIGALVAVLMQRNTAKPVPVAVVTSTPGRPIPPTRIPAPVTIATLEPPHTPQASASATVTPTAAPTESPSLEPSPTPTGVPSPKPPRAPVPKPSREPNSATAAPRAAHAVAAAPTPSETQTPEPVVPASAIPSSGGSPASPVASARPVAPAAPVQTQSSYDERASAVVRRYIGALIRGDEKAAYAALGGTEGPLSEQAFLDPGARIVSLKVTRIDASNASVGCEIASAKGHYYGTYHVKASSGGPYISEHDYIKV
jgi:outer membrane biosynthesis protein TonB